MSLLQTVKDVLLVPTHPKGKPIIIAAIVATLVLWMFSDFLAFLGLLFILFSVYFFRDPSRVSPQGEGFILATGDGVVCDISDDTLPKELDIETEIAYQRVSIFLNMFNVHVNRLPIDGTVTREVYIPGKFLNASLDKASTENERSLMAVTTESGEIIGCSQIAGFVARRIVCQVDEGDKAEAGKRYGIIRFGSRCDVYIPKSYDLAVSIGSVCTGGETMLAIDKSRFDPSTLTWNTN